jgi:hypothetical protein
MKQDGSALFIREYEYVRRTTRRGFESDEWDGGYLTVYGTIGLSICTMLYMVSENASSTHSDRIVVRKGP